MTTRIEVDGGDAKRDLKKETGDMDIHKSDEQVMKTRYPHAESWGSMGSGEAPTGTKT